MIKNLKPRLYQETILATCSTKNTLVVLPTGMGKSIVFVMLAAQRLMAYPKSKILVLAPTKPLCEQHVKTFKNFLIETSIELFTGEISPEKREKMFKDTKIIVSTPQGLENDIISSRINLDKVSLLVFDECHRAVKDYSYTWIAKHYIKHASFPRILGLTASPGSDLDKIKEVCSNLSIEAIEIRTPNDPDVKPYIQDVKTEYIEVKLDEKFKKIQKYMKDFITEKSQKIEQLNINSGKKISSMTKYELLSLQRQMFSEISGGSKNFEVLKAISLMAEILKMHHALELLESQGITSLSKYFEKILDDSQTKKTKAVQNMVRDLNFRSSMILTDSLKKEGVEHPKLEKLMHLLKDINSEEKVIIFNNFRDNALRIKEKINSLENINARLFVGQAKKSGTGLSQKEQIQMLEDFRQGKFNTIIMTSVGEEGLDIPKVDYVYFYEPVPSAIRHIQRKGRTGRLEKGEVKILTTLDTRDQGYRWSAYHKERKMYSNLKELKDKIHLEDQEKDQTNLADYQKKLTVYADHREKASKAIKTMVDQNVDVKLKQLEVADYILSDNVGVELKTVPDFVASIVDGRLLDQIKDLKYNFSRPIIILEGEEDLYSIRKVHPNAIRGMIATIAVSFQIPIIKTRNFRETAEYLITIAKREQQKDSSFTLHPVKRGSSLRDQQEYFISALPDIGPKLAKQLLKELKTPKKIINASVEHLQKIEKIGKTKAQALREFFDSEY